MVSQPSRHYLYRTKCTVRTPPENSTSELSVKFDVFYSCHGHVVSASDPSSSCFLLLAALTAGLADRRYVWVLFDISTVYSRRLAAHRHVGVSC